MNKNIINLNYNYHVEVKEYLDTRKYTERFEIIIYTFSNILLVIFFTIFNSNPSVYNTFIIATILFAGQFLFYLFSKHKIKKIIKNNPSYTNQVNLKINEKEIKLSQNNIKRIIPWNYIIRLKELKKTILIYYSPYKSIVIPKRVISDNELKFIKYKLNIHQNTVKKKRIVFIIIPIIILIILFYLYQHYTYRNHLLLDEMTIIERPANQSESFNYPYLLYIPKDCNNKKNYLIIKPNASGRKKYYHNSDMKDAKKMLEKWILTTSKYNLNSLVLVPVFPRPEIPEGPAQNIFNLSNEELSEYTKQREQYKEKMKEYYKIQEIEKFEDQLFNMTKDARRYLKSKDIIIEDKLIVFGYAHDYSLSTIFSFRYLGKLKFATIDEPIEYDKFVRELLEETK